MAKVYYKAIIELLVEVDEGGDAEGGACDAIAEGMRSNLQDFAPDSSWIDWRYAAGGHPEPHDGAGFEHADRTPA